MARIHWIKQPHRGNLGVMARPGRHTPLEEDLRAVRDEGVDVLVSLLTSDDMREYGLEDEPRIAESLGLDFKRFAIEDRATPAADGETLRFLQARLSEVEQGQTVVFHCSSGRGRTGVMAASLLVLGGMDPDEAMKHVRGHRLTPVPDTPEQMEWVRDLARRMGMPVRPRASNPWLVPATVGLGLVVAGLAAWYVAAGPSRRQHS